MTGHVVPIADLIVHEVDDAGGCPCVPSVEPVALPAGGIGWLLVHHSLDGREFNE